MAVHAVPRRWPGSTKSRERNRRTRVWLNGEDVTARCFYADPRRGVVRLFSLDLNGRKFVKAGRIAREERRGRVVVRVRRDTGARA